MIQTKLVKSGLEDLKRITRADYALYDKKLNTLVSTFENSWGDSNVLAAFAESSASSQNANNYYYTKLDGEDEEEYILVTYAGGNDGYMLSRIAASEIVHFMGVSSARLSKENFYKDVLNNNVVQADVYRMATKLKLDVEKKRTIYAVSVDEEFINLSLEIIRNMYMEKNDYAYVNDNGLIILIKDITGYDDFADVAYEIVSMINTEIMVKTQVTYGHVAESINDLSEIYKEATMAMEVMGIFYEDREVASYDSLGMGRLIQQLPKELCQMFLDQVLGKDNEHVMSGDDMQLMEAVFENNLNIAETARSTGIGRTTLIYRLDRIYKRTGYDVRRFDDALTIKIAMMIAKYLSKF